MENPQTIVGGKIAHYYDATNLTPIDTFNSPFIGSPNIAGTHAQFLQKSRDLSSLKLIQAIAKLSYLQAEFLGANGIDKMNQKGRLQVGMDADITIFNYRETKDNSTMESPELNPSGFKFVIINGKLVLNNGVLQENIKAGQAIRRPH